MVKESRYGEGVKIEDVDPAHGHGYMTKVDLQQAYLKCMEALHWHVAIKRTYISTSP
jgi:hypothetical protein